MNFTEVKRCVWGPRTPVRLHTETSTHKVNTCLILVSSRGRTVCKTLWVLLAPVGIS